MPCSGSLTLKKNVNIKIIQCFNKMHMNATLAWRRVESVFDKKKIQAFISKLNSNYSNSVNK